MFPLLLSSRSPIWRAKCTFGDRLSQWLSGPRRTGRRERLHYAALTLSLLLKVVVTPVLIAIATLAGRRWGDRVSGWLVGLPLTSGPVVFFLALDQGSRFASMAALGVLLGTISQAAFAVTYARLAARAAWPVGAIGATMVFAAAT